MRIPTIYDIKPRFQACLRPLSARLAAGGVTANQVTIGGVVISLLAGLAVALWPEQRWPLLALPLVLFVRMALNAIDGMLAREFGMRSALGGLLNELGDVFSDVFLYLPFAVRMPGIERWIYAFVLLAVIGEMAGVVGVAIGASRRYDGPLGKSDRAFAIGLLALLIGVGVPQGIWVDGYWMILCILAAATIRQRGRAALKEVAR
jgi:CDP-diacylglycerol--glycerol-3-phosphate 3-phosphatidyltransferase